MDPESGDFVHVPMPEGLGRRFQPGMARSYQEIFGSLERFRHKHGVNVTLPEHLRHRRMHLDPDFDFLTYGDNGRRHGAGLLSLKRGDLVAFYAGLRPVQPCQERLVYALVGLYVVDVVHQLGDIPRSRWHENAHTRRFHHAAQDIIVRGQRGVSGRLERCVPIGERCERAYRVRADIVQSWGGLSVKDGYIRRRAVPPKFSSAAKFYEWFLRQEIAVVASNA